MFLYDSYTANAITTGTTTPNTGLHERSVMKRGITNLSIKIELVFHWLL